MERMKIVFLLFTLTIFTFGSNAYGEILFQDNFDSGPSPEWQVTWGSWYVEDGTYCTDYGQSRVGDSTWGDYILEVDVKGLKGCHKHNYVRVQEPTGSYGITIRSSWVDPNATFILQKDDPWLVWANPYNENGVWYHIKIIVEGSRIQGYVDDVPYIDYTDSDNPFLTGGIQFIVNDQHLDDAICVDNVLVTSLAPLCIDADADGYGNPASDACPHPELDCDDTNPDVNPGAIEQCGQATCKDGLDNDCDGLIDAVDPDCKEWCPQAAEASTVGSMTGSGPWNLNYLTILLIPAAILIWKGWRYRR